MKEYYPTSSLIEFVEWEISMEPIIAPEHPVFRIIICYAFGWAERSILAKLMKRLPVMMLGENGLEVYYSKQKSTE